LLFAVVVAAPLGFSSLLATGDGGGTGVRRPGGSSAGEALVDLTLPATLGARWVSSDAPLPELRPVFPGAASVVSKVYDGGDGPVGVYMAHYRREDPQAKLVSSVNVLVAADDPVWNQLGTQPLKREGASGPTRVRVAELMGTMSSVATDRPRLKVWQFYWIDGHTTASDIEAKLLQAWQRLRGRGEAGTAIVLYTLEGPSNDGQSRLDRLMRDGFADLDGRLRALDRGVSVRP
jgi:EpsI family protein